MAKKLPAGNSCKIGENVLIYYSDKYEAFVVHNNDDTLHFVHTDCVQELLEDHGYVCSIIDKEYCVARRV